MSVRIHVTGAAKTTVEAASMTWMLTVSAEHGRPVLRLNLTDPSSNASI